MIAVRHDEAVYLDARLAHIRKVQTRLELNQLRLLKLAKDATPGLSPAVVVAISVTATVFLLCPGAAIGALL